MESSSFKLQVKRNLWLYTYELRQLNNKIRTRKVLKTWLKSFSDYRQLIEGTSDFEQGLINPNIISVIENLDLISAISWEIDYLDGVILNHEKRLKDYKNRPIWIPLG